MTLAEQIKWCKGQIKKGYEVVAITSILKRLKLLEKPKEPPHPCHNEAIAVYKDFLVAYGLPQVVDGMQGRALKELLPKLQNATASKTPKSAVDALRFILNNWSRTSTYHQSQKSLSHINKYLVEILDQIKNGATRKQSNLNEAERFRNELMQQSSTHDSKV